MYERLDGRHQDELLCAPSRTLMETLMEKKEIVHRVIIDRVGLHGRLRLTCATCGVTCLYQPFMDEERWRKEQEKFNSAHPCDKPEDEGWRG